MNNKKEWNIFLWFFRFTYGLFIIFLIVFFGLEIFYSFFGISPKMSNNQAPKEQLTVPAVTEFATAAVTSVASTRATATVAQSQTVNANVVLSPVSPTDTNDNSNNDSMVLSIIGLLSIYGAVLAYVFHHVVRTELERDFKRGQREVREELHALSRYERKMSEVEMRTAISFLLSKVAERKDDVRYGELTETARSQDLRISKSLEKINEDLPILQRIEDGFDEDEYKLAMYRTSNFIAFHLAELQDLKNKQNPYKKKTGEIDHDARQEAKKHSKILRTAIETGDLEKVNKGDSIYREQETCTWVDWVFASGTPAQIKTQRAAALKEFKALLSCSPASWHKEMQSKYVKQPITTRKTTPAKRPRSTSNVPVRGTN